MQKPGDKLKFVPNVLPWVLAAAALTGFLLTINPWVSFFNLSQVARLSGWAWSPELSKPAYYIVTLPLHWLPFKWVPLGLNLFSALCAALTLGQLARSVALLPHDRTLEQRLREGSASATLSIPLAWLPPVLAVIVCGFQLTFWEHATNGTSEMFDLLLFSYVVRSLLEYRIDRNESRLLRTAFVYGVGMTNNFAMVGFFPAFVGALVWIRGFSFFNFSFLTRMALSGLAGLSLYLLLPLLAMFHSVEPLGFWAAIKANVGEQLNVLFQPESALRISKRTIGVLALTSLLPALIIAIRWASYFGDSSRLGNTLATLMFHIVHACFLLACLWVFLDPPFSPRQKGSGISFLTFYYLGALSVGYLGGYFLLVFRPVDGAGRVLSPSLRMINQIVTGSVVVLWVLISAGLITRNLPQIRTTNGPDIKRFATLLAEGLPQSGAVLSDSWHHLLIVRSWLALDGRDKNFLFLSTQSLPMPGYNRYLHKKYPQKWESPPNDPRIKMIRTSVLINRLLKLSRDTDIYYLHPSFGYYFEVFFLQPHGLVFALKRYEPGTLLPPELTSEAVAENDAFWTDAVDQTLKPFLATSTLQASGTKSPVLDRLFEKLHVPRGENVQNSVLAAFYSRSLNYWGVEMQKKGELDKAAAHFDLALQLNPDNVVAHINLECNKQLRAGNTAPIEITKSIEESLGRYKRWHDAINANGPYDEPNLCYAQAWAFLQTRHYRQAAQNLNRVCQFSPTDLPSRIALSQVNNLANLPDGALAITAEIRNHPERFTLTRSNLVDLAAIEASAWFVKKEPEKAAAILKTAIEKSPDDDYLLANAASVYMQRRDFTNALAVQERRLKLNPDNLGILVNKAYIDMELENFNAAIAALNRVLTTDPTNHVALLNRAIAFLRMGRLDKAEEDYESLEKQSPNQFQIQYGLGEIAWQRKDTNTAIRHYQTYLTNAPPNTAEARSVADRLRQLKGEKPK